MIASIHQPNFLPWQGYFYKIANSDIFVLFDTVQYTKNGYQNRNLIKTPQGALWLTVPVLGKGKFGQATNEVSVNNNLEWGPKIWKTIHQNYRKAKYFNLYSDYFEEIFSKEWELLNDLNTTLLIKIIDWLEISTPIKRASEMNVAGKSSELLVNICKELNADIYLSGFGGEKYMENEIFEDNKIKIKTYDYAVIEYPQLYGDFISNLSIIDLLFNCGPESLGYLLSARK
jgi:hypothetical protein